MSRSDHKALTPRPVIASLSPQSYQPSQLHQGERGWAETNCYVDVWIELLHALGHDPMAAMAFTLGIDFEGDQWTFFKFPLNALYQLYAIQVEELALWQPLPTHITTQIELGRIPLVEVDSYFLPDTQGTAYQQQHVKTTIAINQYLPQKQQMDYFHGQGYYRLEGDDFNHLFAAYQADNSRLAPYVEIAKLSADDSPSPALLRQISLGCFVEQVKKMPKQNPFEAFALQLQRDLPQLQAQSMEYFHQYAFATLRQLGACYELAGDYLDWLKLEPLAQSAAICRSISETAKTFQFQLARTISRGKPLDMAQLNQLGDSWLCLKQGLEKSLPALGKT